MLEFELWRKTCLLATDSGNTILHCTMENYVFCYYDFLCKREGVKNLNLRNKIDAKLTISSSSDHVKTSEIAILWILHSEHFLLIELEGESTCTRKSSLWQVSIFRIFSQPHRALISKAPSFAIIIITIIIIVVLIMMITATMMMVTIHTWYSARGLQVLPKSSSPRLCWQQCRW